MKLLLHPDEISFRSAAGIKKLEPHTPHTPQLSKAIAHSLHQVIPPQSGGQQVLVLIHLRVFCCVLSQHRQPLGAGGDPAGSEQNQTQKKEKNGDKRVAADGYHSRCGQSCRGLLLFHH